MHLLVLGKLPYLNLNQVRYNSASNWKEHLLTIEDLREGIGFRSYAQKNPEHEYKIEAHALFSDMLERVRETYICQILNLEIQTDPSHAEQAPQQHIGNRMLTPFD